MTKTLDDIEQNRLKREGNSLANKFEKGISIFNADRDNFGKKRLAKEKFIEALTWDVDGTMSEDKYTPEEMDRIRKSLSRMTTASGLLVTMTCPGANMCPFSDRCPFANEKKEPAGKPCPLEHILFSEILVKYMESLEIDPTNMMELAYANELAETEILIMRANKALSKAENAELVQETSSIIAGQRVDLLQVSPHIEVRDKLVRRRERIIKLMVGDRQEKYKAQAALKKRDAEDESKIQSKRASMLIEANLSQPAVEEKVLTPDDILGEINSDVKSS